MYARMCIKTNVTFLRSTDNVESYLTEILLQMVKFPGISIRRETWWNQRVVVCQVVCSYIKQEVENKKYISCRELL